MKKKSGKGAVRTGKRFTSFFSNEDLDYIIRIEKSLEKSGLLTDVANKTVKHEIRKWEGGLLGVMMLTLAAWLIPSMPFSLIKPVVPSLINAITGKGVMRAGKGLECRFLPVSTFSLNFGLLRKRATRSRRWYSNIDHMGKIF